MKKLWNSFKIAFSMYSRIPMPASEWTEENTSYAMCFFPWVGAVIGMATWAVYQWKLLAGRQGAALDPLFFTVLLLILPVAISGGIHMDGFLDTQDALSSWQPAERRLEILKDPHIGAFAVLSCGVYFLMYLGVYASLTGRSVKLVCLGFLLSRTLSGISVLCFPQARKQGLAASFSRGARKRTVLAVLFIYLGGIGAAMLTAGGLAGLICLLAAGGVFGYYYRMSRTKFGGVTGDLAGYFLQVCELAVAAAAVVATAAVV